MSKTLPGRSPTGLTPAISGVLKCRDDMTGEKVHVSFAELGGPGHIVVVGGVREGRGGAEHVEEEAVVVFRLEEVLCWGVPPRWGVTKL